MAGKIIGGYEIRGELGRGGMGVVYLAYDRKLEREVAVKVLAPELASNAAASQRFMREARAAAQLNHAGIVRVYDVVQYEHHRLIAMEYIRGKTLAQLIQDSGPLPVKQAVQIAAQAADALAAAHEKGVIHRDIKPHNVMVCLDGRVKVLDFGLAKVREGVAHLTATGAFLGTPMYMSPEQCRSKPVDARTDIYSLGVTLLEMLRGSPPFQDATPLAIMHQILNAPLPKVTDFRPSLPRAVGAVVEKMTAKDPADRFDSAGAVADALRESLRWKKIDWKRFLRPRRDRKTAILIALAIVFLSVMAVIGFKSRSAISSFVALHANAIARAPQPAQRRLTDSSIDFSNVQGQNNWYYGYYDRALDSTSFRQMEKFKDMQDFGPSWYGEPFLGAIWAGGARPFEARMTVRRWVSNVEGNVSISVNLAKINTDAEEGRDGVTGHVVVDGKDTWSAHIEPANYHGVFDNVDAQVRKGSTVDLVLDAGADWWGDESGFQGIIYLLERPKSNSGPSESVSRGAQKLLANSEAHFSSTQGEHGWHYGYYSNGMDSRSFQEMRGFLTEKKTWSNEDDFGKLWASGGHAGKPSHFCVRRWISNLSGTISLSGDFAKIQTGQAGDGVTGMIVVDGTEIWKQHVNKDDGKGFYYSINATVSKGSTVDFVIDPGGTDWEDGTKFTVFIMGAAG